MEDANYFKRVSEEFDIHEDIRAAVWTAQWFVENKLFTLEEALSELKITQVQYDKYKTLPQS